jgi:hypothetical protein
LNRNRLSETPKFATVRRILWDTCPKPASPAPVDRVVEERCFLAIHVYDTVTSRPVAVLLRPGKTPSGNEIRDSRMVPAVSR